MMKFWRKILFISVPSIFFAILTTTIKTFKKAFSLINLYYVEQLLALWKSNLKFQKEDLTSDGRLSAG